MIKLRVPRWWLVAAGVLYGAAAFVWIGIEDQSLLPVSLLGAAGAGLGTLHLLRRRAQNVPLSSRKWLKLTALYGLLGGLAAAPLAALLMALKVSLHGHAVPDFSPADVLGVLARAPVWSLAGLTIGVAVGLVGLARRTGS